MNRRSGAIRRLKISLKGGLAQEYTNKDTLTVGRSSDADFTVPDESVSREHLKIVVREDGIFVKDLGSSNGTRVGTQKVAPNELVKVQPDQPVAIGRAQSVIYIRAVEDPASPEARPVSSSPAPAFRNLPDKTEIHIREPNPLAQVHSLEVKKLDELIRGKQAALDEIQTVWQRTLAEVNSSKAEKEKIDKAIRTAEAQYREVVARAKQEQADILARTETEYRELLAKHDQERARIEREFETKIEERKSQISAHDTRIDELKVEITELQKQSKTNRKIAEESMKDREKIQAEHANAEALYKERLREMDLQIRKVRAEEETYAAERKLKLAQIERDVEEMLTSRVRAEKEMAQARYESEKLREQAVQAKHAQEEALHLAEAAAKKEAQSHSRCDELRAEADGVRAEIEKLRSQAYGLIKDKKDAENEIQSLRDQAKADATALIKKAEDSASEVQGEASAEAKKIREEAQEWGKQARAKAQQDAEAMLIAATEEAERLKSEAHEFDRTTREKIAAELEKHNRDAEMEIAQMKAMSLNEIQDQQEKDRRAFEKRLKHEADQIARALEKAIATRVAPGSEGGSAASLSFADLRTIARGVLIPDHASEATEELKKILPVDEVAKERAKRFWMHSGVAAVLAIGLVILGYAVPGIYGRLGKRMVRVIQAKNSQSDAYVKQFQDERAASLRYAPAQDRTFKDSYTDNIILLEHFAEMMVTPAIEKKWTLELNQFFLKELHLTEKLIVNFSPVESRMLRELIRLRGFINPAYELEGIQRMREVEAAAVEEMRKLLGGEGNLLKFRAFQQNFYYRNSPN